MDHLNAKIVDDKLDHFFKNLKGTAKVNLYFGFGLKNIENGSFRYFYAHENNTMLHRSKHVCKKDDMAELKNLLNKTDVIQSFSRERLSKKRRFYKLKNLTVFAAVLKMFLWGASTQFYPNFYWELVQSTVSRMKKI